MANAMHTSLPATFRNEAITGVKGGARVKDTLALNQNFTRIVKRQMDLLSESVADADEISGSGQEPDPKNSKGLNTTPIVWMCVILVAIVLLIIFCVLGHRRQNKRDQLAGDARIEKERRLPQVGIVG